MLMKWLLTLLLSAAAVHAAIINGVTSGVGADVDSTTKALFINAPSTGLEMFKDRNITGALTDFCLDANINSCNAASQVVLATNGANTAAVITSGSWSGGAMGFDVSYDKTTPVTWFKIASIDAAVGTLNENKKFISWGSSLIADPWLAQVGGATFVRIRMQTAITGTANVVLTAANGLDLRQIQELKDTGRTAVNYFAVAAASGATGVETMITLTRSSNGGAVTTGTTFALTAGKRYRITSIIVESRGNATATAQVTNFALRVNTAGAVVVGSNQTLAMGTSTPATALAFDRFSMPIPDGYDIAGDGTVNIGMSANSVFVTNAPTWYVTITGFEY